jgi:Tol biopolymer transport system component
MNPYGSARSNSAGGDEPAWSPDGERIAFSSTCCLDPHPISSGKTSLFVMDADGSGRVNLTNTPSEQESAPDWQTLPGSNDVATIDATPPEIALTRPGDGWRYIHREATFSANVTDDAGVERAVFYVNG